ncbi:ferrous iron transport protein B [mine drainage metagenome]|uniref:Ferrous iron transport protein B n=1 Tax=mine drainage metagenome TaxID=410659 RepID=A0A1J5T2P6_9ZZZZ
MRAPVYALVGNPNCGKSTLFNALTGLKQKVGNYPGVTVEKHEGTAYSQHGQAMKVIDLPGAYSLASRSPDEAVMRDVLLGRREDTPQPDRIVCIVDASNLERHLYQVLQILDLGRPVILVLNMMDLAENSGVKIRVNYLERMLGIPVIPCEADKGRGIIELKLAMSRHDLPLSKHRWDIPAAIAPAVAELQASLGDNDGKAPLIARAEALLLLTDHDHVRVAGSTPLHAKTEEILKTWKARWSAENVDWAAILVKARFAEVGRICTEVVERRETRARVGRPFVDRLDEVLTHPVWGWLIFISIMGLLFLGIFTLAEYPMNWIDSGMGMLADWVRGAMPPGDLRDLITDGALSGLRGIVIFLPQILILFFSIGLLESTGYMARAAVMMDRIMGKVGLSGRSFIPLLSSYACAIPGIMATRTIEDRRDRLTTILVAPLMSCSARLPVYLLMIAALVPGTSVPALTKTGIMLLMYSIGTFGALGYAWLFRRTLLKGKPSMMMMEMPAYQLPSLRTIVRQMLDRASAFLFQAGTVILSLSILLWALAAYPKSPAGSSPQVQLEHSYAGDMGRLLEPTIKPLGFNWQIGVGLVSSFAAREVFVSTMGVIFDVQGDTKANTVPLRDALRQATWPDGHRLFTPLVCFNLMLYYVFAMQCLSTVAVVYRETKSWFWPTFQILYMTGTAWVVCFVVYQVGRLAGF